jgi:citrate lyase beta subunit/uncharacterized protein YndB with AHSA1/START domain
MTHEFSILDEAKTLLDGLTLANSRVTRRYPGEPATRQPVHTVYGGAQLFEADLAARLGQRALAALDAYAPDAFTFARAIGMAGADALPAKKKARRALIERVREAPDEARAEHPSAWLAVAVYDRMRAKLEREPVEDFRIDFEDGYGVRPEAEEDATAVRVAEAVAQGHAAGTLPPFVGIRIKPLNEEMKRRAARTLDLFFTTLVARTGGAMPPWLAVTLPKVQCPEQAQTLARLLDRLERRLGLPDKSVKIELMIELTQSIFDPEGRLLLPRLAEACEGRCVGAHFGTYDYTASYGITAAWQAMGHPACQLALGLMKIAYAGTGIALSDGATNVLPVPIHRGEELGKRARRENAAAVHGAWALAYRNIQRSMENGYYQGWDLHPAQLPVRYAATFEHFLRGFDAAAKRLSNFVEKAAQATLVGEVFDDAATGQGLLNYFLRAHGCGAISTEELAATGLTMDELKTRSFVRILEGRSRRLETSARGVDAAAFAPDDDEDEVRSFSEAPSTEAPSTDAPSTDALELVTTFAGVSPEALYDAWLDAATHAAMTGGEATSEARVGGRYTAWDGYIEGTHLELDPPRRIVQSWRSSDFPVDAPDSTLELTFEAIDEGTRLTLRHKNIPAGQGASYEDGWEAHYFAPMRAHFAG